MEVFPISLVCNAIGWIKVSTCSFMQLVHWKLNKEVESQNPCLKASLEIFTMFGALIQSHWDAGNIIRWVYVVASVNVVVHHITTPPWTDGFILVMWCKAFTTRFDKLISNCSRAPAVPDNDEAHQYTLDCATTEVLVECFGVHIEPHHSVEEEKPLSLWFQKCLFLYYLL